MVGPLRCLRCSGTSSHSFRYFLAFLSRFIRNRSCETSEYCESYRPVPTRLVLSPTLVSEAAGIRVPAFSARTPSPPCIFVSRRWPLPPSSAAYVSSVPRDWPSSVKVPGGRALSAPCVSVSPSLRTLPSFSLPGTSDSPRNSIHCPPELLPVSVPLVLRWPRSAAPPVVYRWRPGSRSAPPPIGKAARPPPDCCTLARIHPTLSGCGTPDR